MKKSKEALYICVSSDGSRTEIYSKEEFNCIHETCGTIIGTDRRSKEINNEYQEYQKKIKRLFAK